MFEVCVSAVGCVASGMGVFSLLCCRFAWAGSVVRAAGGKYVCPVEGVKVGSVEAVFMSRDKEVTAESYDSVTRQ